MQKRTILGKLIPVILLLGLIWAVFFISKALLQEPENSNLNFLPKDANWSLQVDFRKIMEQSSATTIFNKEEQELNDLLEEFIADEDRKEWKLGKYGIQFNSSVIFFGIEEKQLLGALVNLTNERKFNANFSKKIPDNTVCYGKNKVGIILFSQNETENKKLLSLAKKMLETNNSSTSKSEELIEFRLKESIEFSKVNDLIIKVNSNDNFIKFSGQFNLNENFKLKTFPSLKPQGFHVDWQNIPSLVSDSLGVLFGGNFPEIHSISINFKGSELVTEPRMALGVDADVLIQFADSLDVTRFVLGFGNEQKLNLINDSSFEYANSTFYFKQVDYRSLYIGRDKFNKNFVTSQDAILSISGDASALTNVAGEGLARKLLNILPLFKASEKLSHSIENITLNVAKSSGEKAFIEGEIQFKEGEFPINEFLKFILIVGQ